MKEKEVKLRCYIKKDGDLWVAMCIDLCLGAQSNHPKVAIKKLESQIIDYMYDITEGDLKDQFHNLYPRRAPWSIRLDYFYCFVIYKFKSFFGRKYSLKRPKFYNQMAAHQECG